MPMKALLVTGMDLVRAREIATLAKRLPMRLGRKLPTQGRRLRSFVSRESAMSST